MNAAMPCVRCGGDLPAAANFCPSCGQSRGRVCASCGAPASARGRFCADCGARLVSAEPGGADAPIAPVSGEDDFGWTRAERRQLSILFADLVGSMTLARRLDPEEFGGWMARYQQLCTRSVSRYGGYLARYLGDGVLAYFGYPQAHEDNAERAIRAGLEIVAGMPAIAPAGVPEVVRVGIATGPVIVGEIARGAEGSQGEVFGETPGLAARLQSMAEPGTVLVDDGTRGLVHGLFRLTPLGPREAKGVVGGVETWRVDGFAAATSRFAARHPGSPERLIGREAELALLSDRWIAALAGEGQVVLVSGEAGIGKSALIRAFENQIAGDDRATLTLSCAQYYQDIAFHPVLTHLEAAASFDLADDPERKREKLAQLLRRIEGMPRHSLALLAEAMRLPAPVGEEPLRMTPQRRKEELRAALIDYIQLHATHQPLLLLVEDLQWIDPTTQELLVGLCEGIRSHRVLIVITARPGTDLGSLGDAQFAQIMLNRLGRRHAAGLVAAAARHQLPESAVDEIVRKADGVPLYLEELVAAVLKAGAEDGTLGGPGEPKLSIPSTLQGSLLERLDRLPAIKEVAHVCAVIGRDVSPDLLAAVLAADAERLSADLDRLVHAGLLARRRGSRAWSFTFKHALLQEAIYDSLLLSRRRELHARVARAMEALDPEGRQTEPSLLAHHYAQAQLIDQAVKHLQAAGQRALRQSAAIEAAALIGRALSLLGTTSRNASRDRNEVDLQIAMGQALIAGKGVAFPDVGHAFERARELCDELGDTAALFPIMLAKCRSHQLRGELRAAADVAQDFAHRAAGSREATVRAMAHRCMGLVCYHDGRIDQGRQSFEAALRLYDPGQRASVSFQLVNNPKIVCCIHLSGLYFALGRDSASARWMEEAQGELEWTKDPFDQTVIFHHASLRSVFHRDRAAALAVSGQLCALAEEQGFPQFHAMGLVYRGWARALGGDWAGGCEELEKGITLYRRTGAELNSSLYHALTAEAFAAGGQQSRALDHFATAIRWSDETQESTCGFAAEVHRLMASTIATHAPAGDPAVMRELERAIEIAEAQGGVTWAARATIDLADQLARAGRIEEAARRVRCFVERLEPEHDGADIDAARALAAQSTRDRPPSIAR